jgi:hypothetical protein
MTGTSVWHCGTTKYNALRRWVHEKQVPFESGSPSLSERDASSTTQDPQDQLPKTQGGEERQAHPDPS